MTRQIKHPFSAAGRRVKRSSSTGADQGFPVGGAPTFQGGGANIQFCNFFQKKKHTMESRKCWAVGGAPEAPPLRSATVVYNVMVDY